MVAPYHDCLLKSSTLRFPQSQSLLTTLKTVSQLNNYKQILKTQILIQNLNMFLKIEVKQKPCNEIYRPSL